MYRIDAKKLARIAPKPGQPEIVEIADRLWKSLVPVDMQLEPSVNKHTHTSRNVSRQVKMG